MLWGLALLALIAFVLAFTSHSPGWMGFGIFVGFVAAIAAALVFIDRHVRASSLPQHSADRGIQALLTTLRNPGEPPRRLPPSDPH